MAVAVREVIKGQSGSALALSTSSAVAVGDVVVAWQGQDYATVAATATQATSSTLTLTRWGSQTATASKAYLRAYVAPVTTAGVQTISFNDLGDGNHCVVYVLTGADVANPVASFAEAQAGDGSNSQSSFAAPTASPGAVDGMLLCAWQGGFGNTGTTTVPGSMTNRQQTAVTDSSTMTAAQEALSSAAATGTRTCSSTQSGTSFWRTASIVVNPTAGGTPAGPEPGRFFLAA